MIVFPLILAATASCSAASPLSKSPPLRKLQPAKDQVDPTIYWDECWVDLPPDVQEGYVTLGYTEDIWTNAGVAEYDDYDYWMLPKEQKEAAISLGLTEEFWCNDPDTGKNECFALEADIPPEFATQEQPEWNDYDWWELPQGLKEVLLANQYTEESWCNDEKTKENECLVLEGDIPSEFASQYWGDSDWVELPDELKEALVSAGLNEESWCNDGATGDNTCTTLEADITPAPTTASPTPKPTTSSPSKQPTVSPSANPVGESNDGKPTVSPVEMATTTTTATTTVVTTTAEGTTTTTTTTPDETATTTPDETTTVAATTTTVATTTTTEGTTTDATTTVDPTTTAAATTEAPPTTTTTATTTPEDIEPPPNSAMAMGTTVAAMAVAACGLIFV